MLFQWFSGGLQARNRQLHRGLMGSLSKPRETSENTEISMFSGYFLGFACFTVFDVVFWASDIPGNTEKHQELRRIPGHFLQVHRGFIGVLDSS